MGEKDLEVKEIKKESDRGMMKPWEQHSTVISIPRFDYNAPSSLLQRSHSGFLITCTIKREKSATKEVMSILEKHVGSFNSGSSDAAASTKRRKICTDEAGGPAKDDHLSSVGSIENAESNHVLSLVKLTRSGLLLLTFPTENTLKAVDIVSRIFQSLESGNLKSPQWCHRIFPIQATCSLNERELRPVVSKLVLQFVHDNQQKLVKPITFAVGYNRRGIETTEMKKSKDNSVGGDQFALLDRDKCFGIVGSAVKDVVSDSTVDLKSPQVSILIELLPLSGVPKGSLVVAVSVLPLNFVGTKPRLCIRALVSDTNTKKARS